MPQTAGRPDNRSNFDPGSLADHRTGTTRDSFVNNDCIFISELPIHCIIGVHPHERSSRQLLFVSVELTLDSNRAGATDELTETLDYTTIAREVEQCAVNGRFRLIETLAQRLADALLQAPIERVQVEIRKPAALPGTRQVGVRIQRSREAR
jgi:dihydroneopterin aldolase